METRIEVIKTYWVGVSEAQRTALKSFFKRLPDEMDMNRLDTDEAEAVSELRQALLNA